MSPDSEFSSSPATDHRLYSGLCWRQVRLPVPAERAVLHGGVDGDRCPPVTGDVVTGRSQHLRNIHGGYIHIIVDDFFFAK